MPQSTGGYSPNQCHLGWGYYPLGLPQSTRGYNPNQYLREVPHLNSCEILPNLERHTIACTRILSAASLSLANEYFWLVSSLFGQPYKRYHHVDAPNTILSHLVRNMNILGIITHGHYPTHQDNTNILEFAKPPRVITRVRAKRSRTRSGPHLGIRGPPCGPPCEKTWGPPCEKAVFR